jgi:hypothetical protein
MDHPHTKTPPPFTKLRITFLLVLAFISIPLISQTLKKEYETMMNRYTSKQMTQLEFRDMSFAWRALMDSVGYPEVPYDSVSKKIEYTYFNSLEGIPRETIVNRVSEWAAVSFGSPNALLTHQGEASRLILNGYIEVFFQDMGLVWKNSWRGYVQEEMQNSGLCFFTMVVTIREGEMKTQIMNISYDYTDYVSDRTVSRTLASCFPISNNEQDEWKAIITLLNETSGGLESMMNLLNAYIRDFENDYRW